MNKPEVLALNQTITWGGKLTKRKVFRKDQIIDIVKQLQQDQRDADVEWFKNLLANIDIEKELNNYSEEEAQGWFLALTKIRGKLNNERE